MDKIRKHAGRPQQSRSVRHEPDVTMFSPRGIPWKVLEKVNLTRDELEALRLADLRGLYQEDAARKMNISRQTFGRIITSAHKKVADVLINGKAIRIHGGEVMPVQETERLGPGGFCVCPKCNIKKLHRQGIPCQEERCPKCCSRMLREGSYHHNLTKKKTSKEK